MDLLGRKTRSLLAILSFFLAAKSWAQTTNQAATARPSLSLVAARQTAFERNWDLLAARSGIDSAAAQSIVAKEFPNPVLALSTEKIGTHESSTPGGNGIWDRSYDTIASVSQLIEIGGKRTSRQNSARAGVAGARARFFDARRALDQGVTKAYITVLLGEENARILNESARSLHREAEIATTRLHAGDISESDLKQIENNAGQFELQARSAETTAVQARIAVEILLGVGAPAGNWTPTDSLDGLASGPAPAPATAPGAARPDVLAADADLKRAQSDLKLQKAIRIPDPTISLIGEHNPPNGGPPADTFGVGVSLPLPLWNRNTGAIRAAEAARDEAELAANKARARAAADLAGAQLAYQEAAERLRRYQDQIRPRAAQVRESVAYAYSKGGASLVDLLTAERDNNNVRLATSQALSDTASAAADLRAAQTRLTERELSGK